MSKDIKPGEVDSVAKTVETWLGNPLSRSLLKFVSGKGKSGPRLDTALKKYTGFHVNMGISDKIAYRIVKFAIEKGANSFGASKKDMKESLKDPMFRRGLANILEGIAHYGVQRPQTVAAPFLVVWDFTKQCNLHCKHCYQSSGSEKLPDELNTEEAKKVIDDFSDAGVVAIAFSGGEPLLRNDFFEIAQYARDKDFYVSIATNATLITKEIAQRLEKTVHYVEISLDGFEKTHDDFRGIPGVWKKTVKGIRNCVEVGLDTCVATTVTKWNLKEIPKLLDFVENDLKANRMIFFNFVPTRRGKDIVNQDIEPKERWELLKFLYSKLIDKNCKLDVFSTAPQYSVISAEYASGPAIATHFTNKAAMDALQGRTKTLTEFIGGCGCARLYAALEPNGDVYPCVFLPIKVGNIREDKIKDIWQKSEILNKMRNRDLFEGCKDCKYKHICGGCRARAYGYYGDIQGPDPGCIYNIKYWEELKKSAKL